MKYKPNYPHESGIVMDNVHAPVEDCEMHDPFRYLTCTCGNVQGIPVDQSRGDFDTFYANESQESPDGMSYICLECLDENNTVTIEIEDQVDPEFTPSPP